MTRAELLETLLVKRREIQGKDQEILGKDQEIELLFLATKQVGSEIANPQA